MSNQLGRPEGRLHTRSVTPHMSPKIRSAAMRVVKAGTKGGSYGDVSVCLTIGALGLSVFHRPGRHYRPEASSLNRVRNDTIPSGERVVGQSLFGRIGFVVRQRNPAREKEKHDSEACCGSNSWNPSDRFGSDGPGRKLARNWSPRDWLLYERLEQKRDQPARHGRWRLSRKLSLSLQSLAG